MSNRSLNESSSESVTNEKIKQDERINLLVLNLESLSKENFKLKYKVEQLENSSPHFQLKNLKKSFDEKNLSFKDNLLIRGSKSSLIEHNKSKSLINTVVMKPLSSISPMKSRDIFAHSSLDK